jgi:hypothetical protein
LCLQVAETFRTLGLLDVRIDLSDLHPSSSFVSAPSFYENKHGFTQAELLNTKYADVFRLPPVTHKLLSQSLHSSKFIVPCFSKYALQKCFTDFTVSHRSFHTKRDRGTKSIGLGMSPVKQATASKALFDDSVCLFKKFVIHQFM